MGEHPHPLRRAVLTRASAETDVRAELCLDGAGRAEVTSGIGFLDHMLTAFTRHGLFDLTLRAKGDLDVDAHHTTEDIGIVLGQAFRAALGEKRGVRRFGHALLPMDEALIEAAVDLSGRPYLGWKITFPTARIGTMDTELLREFFSAFATNAAVTLHLTERAGENTHHIAEATFKACARALRGAVEYDPCAPDTIPSTKGYL